MAVKVLIRRDSVENFTTEAFVPKEYELVSAFETETGQIVYKIGDGKTSWTQLPPVTKIDEIDRFKVYTKSGEAVEMFLNPFSIREFLNKTNYGDDNHGQKNSDA